MYFFYNISGLRVITIRIRCVHILMELSCIIVYIHIIYGCMDTRRIWLASQVAFCEYSYANANRGCIVHSPRGCFGVVRCLNERETLWARLIWAPVVYLRQTEADTTTDP